jgi:hypothetical protein
MLWIPGGKISKRSQIGTDSKFSSWSWLGWKGVVSFDLAGIEMNIPGPSSELKH